MTISASFNGWLGEATLVLMKKICLSGSTYHDINNVTLQTLNGTTQIDHIIVSRFGVFVIETKTMTGWIFGNAEQPTWTQNFRRSKFLFQNPLRQNFRHIKALEEMLDLPPHVFHSVVTFMSGDCKFKTEMPTNVVNGVPFAYIKSKNDVLLTDAQVLQIIKTIRARMLPKGWLGLSTSQTATTHLSSLKARHSSAITCSKCGSKMLVRTTKTGANAGKQFLGCEKYPACRNTGEIPA